MRLREEVRRDLIRQYQETKDPEVFENLLVRLDALISSTLYRLRRTFPILRNEDPQDLYNEAVLAIYKAIKNMDPDMPGALSSRIVGYVWEYVKWNTVGCARFRRVKLYPSNSRMLDQEDDSFQKDLDNHFRFQEVRSLVTKRVISRWEFDLLYSYFGEEKTFNEMNKELGTQYHNKTMIEIEAALTKIKRYFLQDNAL